MGQDGFCPVPEWCYFLGGNIANKGRAKAKLLSLPTKVSGAFALGEIESRCAVRMQHLGNKTAWLKVRR